MKLRIDLDNNTLDTLDLFCELTNLSYAALISRFVNAHTQSAHELTALVEAHPELEQMVANSIISFGPESLEASLKRLTPPGYATLSQRFEREINETTGSQRTAH